MPVISRRRTAEESRVVRRRDRDADVDVEDEEEEEEDVDVTERPVRRTTKATKTIKKTAKASTTTRRRPDPEEDEDEVDDEEEEYVDDEEDEDEDEYPQAKKAPAKKAPAKKSAPRRRAPVDEDDEDEPASRRPTKTKLPAGFHTGWVGVEETESSFGEYLNITSQPQLIAFLEEEPFLSVRQHWVPSGVAGQPDFPHVCPGAKCPLCAAGSKTSPVTMFNIVLLSAGEPTNKILRGAKRATEALKEAATSRTTGKVKLKGGLFSVNKSGKNQQSQTNFAPVKRRDLEEDWPEVFDFWDPADLDAIIADAEENVFTPETSGIRITPMREMGEMAKYLADVD